MSIYVFLSPRHTQVVSDDGCSVMLWLTRLSGSVNNNNNNNKHEDIYSAVIMAEPLREFTRFTR